MSCPASSPTPIGPGSRPSHSTAKSSRLIHSSGYNTTGDKEQDVNADLRRYDAGRGDRTSRETTPVEAMPRHPSSGLRAEVDDPLGLALRTFDAARVDNPHPDRDADHG